MKSAVSDPAKASALVAVDLGAESCRVSLLRWIDGDPQIQVIHRFPNITQDRGTGLRWNIDNICAGVEEGLRLAAGLAPEGIAAIGVDGWAVDYVRLCPDGKPIADPFCYRDARTIEGMKQVHARIPAERLYSLTGIQILSLNTLYQLYADSANGTDQNIPWSNLPEFLLHRWGGKRAAEFTNATHTQLLDANHQQWCKEIFQAAGLDICAAPELISPGTNVGQLTGSLSSLPALSDTKLIAPACHDTASAIAGIPAHGDDWAFISSGTWSLVGSVLDSPCTSEAARSKNFSNLGGIGAKTCFVKNVNGMWLLQQCIEEWRKQGATWAAEKLISACENLPAPDSLLDVDDPDLLLPGNMPARINAQFLRSGKPLYVESAENAPQLANLIFYSLATRYDAVLRDIAKITGKQLKRLFIVGGGSKNTLLNRLTGKITDLEVLCGSTESTTLGNFAIQLAALAGDYTQKIGVSAKAVAKWAEILASHPIKFVEKAELSNAG